MGSPAFAMSAKQRAQHLWRSRVQIIIAVAIVLAGVALISYPFVSDWLNQREQDAISANQQEAVASLPPEDLSQERQRAEAYNAHLFSGGSQVVDPFDTHATYPGNKEYESVLNVVGDGVMAELFIPKINVDLPIYHYTTDESLTRGVGHVVNTSVPIGGESTHSVLAGHTGLPSARLFDRLDELSVGDWFIIRVLGEDHAYEITSTEVVLPEEVDSIKTEAERDLVTLVTCTPYGINTHRLLVHAERCEIPDGWDTSTESIHAATPLTELPRHLWAYALAGVLVAVTIIVVVYVVLRVRSRQC